MIATIEILRMLEIEKLWKHEARTRDHFLKLAARSEDTEAEGENVGFLADPKSVLYPPLFDGMSLRADAANKIKTHVNNAIEFSFKDPDSFIYFTIYGSGLSYNWDEGGDLDMQLWVDFEKFQQSHDSEDWTADDLLAEIRRLIGPVNFPTFKTLNIPVPPKPAEPCDGSMMIQYYAKLGKGTEEENLVSNPYACYDLETMKWLVRPKPMKPTFYGDHFLMLMPKATDMATQAEQMLDEYERNLLNWQFWFSLYSRYKKAEYREQYQEAQRNVILEKAGIKTMFDAVFGGRAEAYAPGGHGIRDERDIMQKLLEVWGIFQRLKVFARAPLPWDEQELPEAPIENSDKADSDKSSRDSANSSNEFDISHDLSIPAYVQWHNVRKRRTNFLAPIAHDGWKIASLIDNILAQGGGTFTPDGHEVDFKDGYFVSVAGKEVTVPLESLTEDTIIRYAHDWLTPGELLGVWINDKLVYLDSTRHIEDQAQAEQTGREDHQKAIWDISHAMEIFLDDKSSKWQKEAEAKYPPSAVKSPEHDNPGGWAGIMDKAQRLRNSGQVQVLRNGVQNIVGQVQGDNGTYDTEIWRQDPNRNTISLWNCSCPWGGVSWGRTRQWKKYEGRPCAHALALYWEAQTHPLDEEYGQNQQLQIPGIDPFINQQIPNVDLNQAVQQTIQPTPTTQPAPTMPQPVMPQSQPLAPQNQDEQQTIQFPGALSKWHRLGAALNNGDYARINKSMIGFDDRGTQYTVPRNSIVEIIWSDDQETIAIYSLDSGPYGPHNAKITGPTNLFSWVPRTRGTAPRRQR